MECVNAIRLTDHARKSRANITIIGAWLLYVADATHPLPPPLVSGADESLAGPVRELFGAATALIKIRGFHRHLY